MILMHIVAPNCIY